MDYAQKIDEKNFLINKGTVRANEGDIFTRSHPINRTVTSKPINKSALQTKSVGTSSTGESSGGRMIGSFRQRSFRRLTEAEMHEKLWVDERD